MFKKPMSAAVAEKIEALKHDEEVEKMKARVSDIDLDEKIRKAEPYTKAYGDFMKAHPESIGKLKAYWDSKSGGKSRRTRKHRKSVKKHRKTRKH